MKTTLKLKITPIRLYLWLILYPIKPSAGLFNLMKSRETILLKLKILLIYSSVIGQRKVFVLQSKFTFFVTVFLKLY
jgi:hypothetical protein